MINIKSILATITGSIVLLLVLAGTSSHQKGQASKPTLVSTGGFVAGPAKTSALETFRKSPMSFEENQGQTDKRVRFVSRGAGYALFLTGDGAVMKLQNARSLPKAGTKAVAANSPSMPYIGGNVPGASGGQSSSRSAAVLNMRVVGANPAASVTALDRQPNTSNYFIGNDHSKWRTNVANFGKVRYAGVYRGIDLIYYGNQRQLEYDFVVAAGADPSLIGLGFGGGTEGAEKLPSSIDDNGDLVAQLDGGDVRFHKPVIYQIDGHQHRNLIDGGYTLRADGEVGFEVEAYDHSKELVIDPTLTYSTYLGGSNVDVGLGVTLDHFGSCFVTGSTLSTDFPTENPLQAANAGEEDIFITKFPGSAGTPEYSTYVGGSGNDVANDILLDNLGDMTVTGYTTSTDFPLQLPIQPTFGGGTVTGDAFLFQIASHGTAMVYSTYLGGSSDDEGFSLALDSSNYVYVVGYTSSVDFPIVQGALQPTCGLNSSGLCSNGFVLKVTVPPGQNQQTTLTYSTYLGGSGGLGDAAYGIWVDNTTEPPPGFAYVVGITGSPNFPVTKGAFRRTCGTNGKCNGTYDGFVSELNPGGASLVFSTFLGGSGYDYAAGVAVDSAGSVYVSGNTTSTNFPVTKTAVQSTFGGMSAGCVPSSTTTCGDVTITKLKSNGSGLMYSTYLGGSLDENPGLSLALDPGGSVYITGQTDSTNFPLVTPLQGVLGGGTDAFLTKLNPQGTAFSYSTYIGGSGPDSGSRVVLDQYTSAYVSGTTTSINFPTTAGVFQPNCGTDGNCNGGLSDAFAFQVSTSATLTMAVAAPKTVASGATLTYTIKSGNGGRDDASVVAVTDTLPTGTTFKSVSMSPAICTTPAAGQTGIVTCTLGLQPVGTTIKGSIVVNVTASSGATITNTVAVTSANMKGKGASATVSTTVN